MKIVYISGVKFGFELLKFLFENNWPVSIIFSYKDYKQEKFSDFTSFDYFEKLYNIKNVKVDNINDKQNIELLKNLKPDLILVMGWSQIIHNEILNIPSIGVIGSHPTELPKYRGRAPIPWTIWKELKESALTFFFMEEGIDDGDILDQKKFKIGPDDDATLLYEKITDLGKQMLIQNLPLLKNGKATRIKQDNTKFVEYWEKRTPEDGKIHWSKSAKEIHKLIKATTHPYPGAFTFFDKSKLTIWKARVKDSLGDIGKILDSSEEGVLVGTGDGSILIQRASMEKGIETNAGKLLTKKNVGMELK